MEIAEYKQRMARREYIVGGSEAHALLHRMSSDAQRISCVINGKNHTS